MPVFISYRHADANLATGIYNRLRASGISTYLDKFDGASQTTDNITQVITQRIKESTHLLAVVSDTTSQSWWVPFEIGEATITERRIATYQAGYSSLPEYLEKWPIMTHERHLDLFINSYWEEGQSIRNRVLNESKDAYGRQREKPSADNFHKSLKSNIQRSMVY